MPSILNSDDGVVSGTSGLKTTGGNDGITTFQQNGTEAMRIASSGAVGIGKTSVTARLDVRRTSGTTEPIGRFEAAVGSYTGTSLVAANTLGPDSAYNLFSCISDSDGDAGGPFTEFSVRGDGLVFMDSGYGSAAAAYGCRAWVNFDGTGTPAIREDGNVSSITDLGVGSYTINFSVAMPDVNYSWAAGGNDTLNGVGVTNGTPTYKTSSAVMLVGSMGLETFQNSRPTGTQYSNGNADCSIVTVTFFR